MIDIEDLVASIVFTEIEGAPEPDYPSYSEPGQILVELWDISDDPSKTEWEFEVIEYTGSAFWIQEGEGFDYWFESHVVFPSAGRYRIDNVVGHYIRGDGWNTDDDVEWNFSEPVATQQESL